MLLLVTMSIPLPVGEMMYKQAVSHVLLNIYVTPYISPLESAHTVRILGKS